MDLLRFVAPLVVASGLLAGTGCGTPPPVSRMPTARAATDRVHATQDCGLGVHATAKIDQFNKRDGRMRGDLLMFAVWPDRLRLDIVSPFGVTLWTLASDGKKFSLNDLRARRFSFGPASECNIARIATVPMPGHVLVSLLRGEVPVLKHDEADESIEWSGKGYYVVTIKGNNGSVEKVHVAPHPDDFGRPWNEQRLRVLDVVVEQQGITLYHAELADHKPAAMSVPQIDPAMIDPPIPTSGPQCNAELPRRIHVEVPGQDQDVLFRYEDVKWNPPLPDGVFSQNIPGGVEVVRITCDK
ncbi:MAG: hypothetical protein KIT84_26920 [Labilithrix sp.]|nr:hypothetical protein [Labilithrix sp.]MCW5814688.1 hypothetical protein [Labilithrix sp.]